MVTATTTVTTHTIMSAAVKAPAFSRFRRTCDQLDSEPMEFTLRCPSTE